MVGENEKKLVLFDFDGTLTRKDTLFEVLKFLYGKKHFFWGIFRLIPSLCLFKMKIISAQEVKEKVFTCFLKGLSVEDFQRSCDQFVSKKLPSLLRKDALKVMMQFKGDDADIYVVSASAENWIRPWCKKEGINCIATRLEVKEGRLTGKLNGANCNGKEKVHRIKNVIDHTKYTEIYAYGDSKGDLPMLALAGERAFYRLFNT